MHKNDQDIEKMLSRVSFRELAAEEQGEVWSRISSAQQKPTSFTILNIKPMFASLIIALALVLGVGGTVAAADGARPGDVLFGVDRAVEDIRLNFAGDEEKNRLRIEFANERLKEIEDISSRDASMDRPAAADVTASSTSRIEADVFRNETVIKIEYNDSKKFVFTSEAKTKAEVIDEIAEAFPGLSKAFIESKLDFEAEDRDSRAEDKRVSKSDDDLSSDDKEKVSIGINAAINLLGGISASLEGDAAADLKALTDQLNNYLGSSLGEGEEIRVRNEGEETRIELRNEKGKVHIEVRNGEAEIESENDEDGDESRSNPSSTDPTLSLEIEADVFANETVVKLELNDQKSSFTTSADTRAEIVGEIIAKYPSLTAQQVETALKLEIEDRDSVIEDLIQGSDDEDDAENDDGPGNSGQGNRDND